MKEHPNVKIEVQGGGTSVGLTDVSQGTAQIGMALKHLHRTRHKDWIITLLVKMELLQL